MSVVTSTFTHCCTTNLAISSPAALHCSLGSSMGCGSEGCLDTEIFSSLTPSLAQSDLCQTWQHKGVLDCLVLCTVSMEITEQLECVRRCLDFVNGFWFLFDLTSTAMPGIKKHPSSDSYWIEECIRMKIPLNTHYSATLNSVVFHIVPWP